MTKSNISILEDEFYDKRNALVNEYRNKIENELNSILTKTGLIGKKVKYKTNNYNNKTRRKNGYLELIQNGYQSVGYNLVFRPVNKDGSKSKSYQYVYDIRLSSVTLCEDLLECFEPAE